MPAGRPARKPRSAFGERLATARQQAGLTQQQLAERLGTTQRVLTHWESQGVALRADQIAALANLLGVTANYLVGRDSAPKKNGGHVGRARRVFEAVAEMPRHQQKKIIDVVEAFVTANRNEP
jgi:transcriptional regulator with XRE-family HTH domain